MNVFISGGKDKDNLLKNYNSGKAIKSVQDTQNIPHQFQMNKESKIFIFVLPIANQDETLIEFEYFGSGTSYEWYE